MLLPIGFVTLSPDTQTMHGPALTEQDLRGLPSYDGGEIERADEDVICRMLRESLVGPRRYQLPDFRV